MMKNNRYYTHRKEIKKISEAEGVDISTASRMLRRELGWKNDLKEIIDWDNFCVQQYKAGKLADIKGDTMYEAQRTVAFQLTSRGLWRLNKLLGKDVWILDLNGGTWVVTSRKSAAYEAFNNRVRR